MSVSEINVFENILNSNAQDFEKNKNLYLNLLMRQYTQLKREEYNNIIASVTNLNEKRIQLDNAIKPIRQQATQLQEARDNAINQFNQLTSILNTISSNVL